jgi:hypothetical protein
MVDFQNKLMSRHIKKFMIIISCFVLLITTFGVNITGDQIQWDVSLNFVETDGSSDYAAFGESTDANDGPPYDVYDLPKPPAPFPPYIRTWFDDGLGDPYTQLLKDYRSYPDTYKVLNLSVQWVPSDYVSSTTITISWDTNDIESSEYDTVFLCDDTGSQLIDMLVNNNYIFTCPANTPQNYKIICEDTINQAPNIPNVPSGETNGYHGISYTYTTNSTDPDQDNLYYKFDWGDGTTSEWLGSYLSEESCDESHIFESPGAYNITAKAKDVFGEESDWSAELSVFMANRAPNIPSSPTPENETQGVGVNTVLSWVGGDQDTMDIVTYDVYFGTENPPSLVVSKQSGTSFNPGAFNYDTSYYWKIVAWDNHDASTSGPVWEFTTQQSSGGDGDGDGDPTGDENEQPVANASASERFGFVDTLVIFNGSLSSDSDGYITNWSWDLGDGSLGEGEIISHKYTSTGTYEVSLTVTDNKFATHIDSVTVIITTANYAPTKPLLEGIIEGDQQTNYDYKIVSTDLDDDKISYTVNWGDGDTNTSIFLSNGTYYLISHKWILAGIYTVTITATDNKTSIKSTFTILIDVKYVDDLGYFIDENNDDIYDLFYSNESGKTTSVKQQEDGNYLIDINGDDKWDITYNVEAGSTSDYKESKGNGSPGLDVILMLFALIVSIAIIVLRKKNNI